MRGAAAGDWTETYGFDSEVVRARDGTRLRLVVGGPKAAPRVVLLHGAPQLAYTWRDVMAQLAGRYRVIAPDSRGYGASDLAASGRYDIDTLVADLDEVLRATAVPGEGPFGAPVLLVAHDWGGPVVWRFAERSPAMVRHLVAVNAPHPGAFGRELLDPRQAIRSWYIALFQVPKLEVSIERRRASLLLWMMRKSSPEGVFGPRDLAVYQAALERPGRAAAVLAYYREAFGPGLIERRRAILKSPRIDVPATIVWGDADLCLAPTHPRATLRYAPEAEVRTLQGVSHWVPEERPDDVVRAVRDGDASTAR